ncbi:proline--tRNA ligase [Vulcanisaeta souniana JCM 11219]|uniref:Proline--tRNA ligase n=2 Tax=Vulcanisaeta souniana TaxID=164452 RepID=A0A830EEK1_9CREN|nr:proline--tRNA ligase [Vulcanisaeta souniana JCM 11219]GGI69172.1 proline--tRNA ligase [Vulcanisaeta souniana JCM 11219]
METEVYDFRYPVKGAYVWRPYGVKIRRLVESYIRFVHDETGHQEVLFPVFIPYEFLAKESEHIRGFESEVFWVSKGGASEERLVLRPTSETAMMPMFKLWIKDHTDLPFKAYQIVSVFRAETKATRPMIRLREISMFKEAHTAHADREDAEKQVREAVEIYRKIFDYLSVPYLISQRPEWDKFAGAVYTIAFDTVMPDGKTMQIGTVHYLGTNFSRVFDVKYLTPNGDWEYVHTTSYGISERVIAAMIAIHGDDKGLALPPNVAPIQVVIVPIMYKGSEEAILRETKAIQEELIASSVRVKVDDRIDRTPGWKYNYWEMMGVPLRIEIGPKDIENRQVVLARRDTLEKYVVPRNELIESVRELLRRINDDLRESSWSYLRSMTTKATTIEEAKRRLDEGGVVEVPWSGDNDCGMRIQQLLDADALGKPMDEDATREVGGLRDLACNDKQANYWLRVSRRY